MRYCIRALLLLMVLTLLLTTTGDVSATSMVLAQNTNVDLSVSEASQDGINDLRALACNCPTATSLQLLNGAQRAWSSSSYDNSTFAQAQTASYSTGNFIPSEGDVMFIKTGNSKFYKMRPTGQNNSSGIGIEFDYLGSGLPPAPTAGFNYSSTDLIASFTDTSTGSPASWSWDFDDGNTSTYRNPIHAFESAGTYNVCLTASNAGGDSTPACQNVTVSEVPSTWVSPGSTIDFNSDGTADLSVTSSGACGSGQPNAMATINGAQYSWIGGNYDSTTTTDAQNASYGTGSFCGTEADINDTIVVKTSNNAFVKFWTPANSSSGIRFQYEVLDGGLPPVPVASFTSSSIDLIASFTDTSTNTPTSWSWTFGDSGTSTSKNPSHTYASAGTYNVCLTATNSGGSSTPVCNNVTVSQVPSTSLTAGNTLDLNTDGVPDLQAYTCNCPTSMGLSLLNFAERGSVGKAYSAVTLSDAQNAGYGTSNFVQENGDYNSPSVIRTGTGALIKMWAPVNDGGTVRLQFEVLAGGGTPPDPPVASFTSNPSGLSVNFTDTSTNTPTTWTWDFDDTGTSTQRHPSHTYASGGTYNVCLTAANAGGSDSHCQNVTVVKPPTTDFNFSVDGQTADFTDTSTESPSSWSWDFDDGNSSTSQNPSHTFASGGTYNVCLTATNAGGSDVQCRSVTVYGPPTASFTYGTAGLTANFTDTSASVPTSWLWDFGDGTEATSTSQNPSHTYANGGTYNVCLTATNASGSSSPACQNVTVVRPPTASFTFVATGLTVNFTDTSTESPTNWGWAFGDGNVGSTQNPSHTFAATGTYNVCLTATNAGGSSDPVCQDVSVTKPPVASFTLDASALVVDFTDTSTDSPTSWAWDFGDEGSSTQQNPSHTYSEAGTYQVCLTATNAGGSDQACTNLTVYEAPVASFTYTTAGLQANFTDTSTNIPTSWAWVFGDGNISTQQNPSHTYAATGDYTVCLTATNQAGSNQSCGNVSVTKPPTAAFTFDVVGMTTNFSDTSTDNPTSWAWTFGDGGTSNQQDVAHTYASAGTYNVCLTVSNAGGSDQTCQDVTIDPPPTASFTFVKDDLNVVFTDTSTDNPTSWLWDFGDGAETTSTSQNPSHNYTAVGSYTVCLTATNPSGSDQSCQTVSVSVGAPILVNPTGTVTTVTQIFEWSGPTDATWYQVYITNTSGTVLDQWYQVGGSSVTCNTGNCTFTYTLPAEGDYTWYIYGYGPFGNTQWSSPATFTLDVPAPSTINKTAPANTSTLTNTSVTFTWDHDPNATSYQLWVGNGTTPVYNQWKGASSVCIANNCSVTMTLSHGITYTWYIHPYGPGGDGGWGSPFTFTLAIPVPDAINKTAPIGATANATPLFTWDHDNAATLYHIWVGDSDGNTEYDQWLDATTICSGATCSLDTALTYIGNFSWYVHGWSPGGTGPWGSPAAFSYTMSLNTPTGSVSGVNLSYNWNDVGATTSFYHLWVGTLSGTTMVDQWVNASVYCNGTTCTFPTTTTLAAGNYKWFIQPYGMSYGNGSWSAQQTFTATAAPHPEAMPVGRVESDDAAVGSQGEWQAQNTASASGDRYVFSSGDADDVLILEFYGTSIEVIYVTHPAFGSFAIDIDNNIRRTVLTTADDTTFDNTAVVDYLEEGYHTLRIYPVDGAIAIDAFVID